MRPIHFIEGNRQRSISQNTYYLLSMKGANCLNPSAMLFLKNGLRLLRPVAVIASSVVIIFSGVFPLFAYYDLPNGVLSAVSLLLLVGCFVIHGALTHALNDYTDYLSGTDQHSPAYLSGGSRVIQEGRIAPHTLKWIGYGLAIGLLVIAGILALLSYYPLALLLVIGVWGAASYSLPPLRFSYIPLAGEWLSTFPSAFFLGLAGVWIMLGDFPEWAVQNAVINALYCIAWVMIHHIPDLQADQQASPVKRTSVVWSVAMFGPKYSALPAIVYMILIGLCGLWLGTDRLWAAIGVVIIVILSIFFIIKTDTQNAEQVTTCEKKLLLLAMINAVWLGIFI